MRCRRWQRATLELMRWHQEFESRDLTLKCEKIVQACLDGKCDDPSQQGLPASKEGKDDNSLKSDEDHAHKLPPCSHDFASYDLRIKQHNKFGLMPVWYREKQDFDSLCSTIHDSCVKRKCVEEDCKHDIESFDAALEVILKERGDLENRFSLIPFWRQENSELSAPPRTNEKDLPYAAAYPEDAKDPKPASTPSWAPDHIYPHIPAWNPASTVEDHEWTVSHNQSSK
jgi:hypothetical protein